MTLLTILVVPVSGGGDGEASIRSCTEGQPVEFTPVCCQHPASPVLLSPGKFRKCQKMSHNFLKRPENAN